MLKHILLATLVASSYVWAIRINAPVLLRTAHRNDPAVIRFRMYRVLLLCGVLLVGLPPILTYGLQSYKACGDVYRQFGLVPGYSLSNDFYFDIGNVAKTVGLMCLLYLGPIAHYLFTELHNIQNDFFFSFTVLIGVRDHIFAPITEEFVYRAAVTAILKPVVSEADIMKWLPGLFGIAHLHHGLHLYYTDGQLLPTAVVNVLFQLVYTTVFGLVANKIYFESLCNLWSVIVAHAMCNLLGFPSFEMRTTHPKWYYAYVSLLCIGAYSFWNLLY